MWLVWALVGLAAFFVWRSAAAKKRRATGAESKYLRDILPVAPTTASVRSSASGGLRGESDEDEYHREGAVYRWGRYRQPVRAPDVCAPWWRLKQWHYHSLTNGRWFVGLAIANLGYVANAWVYVIDREEKPRPTSNEYRALVPFAGGVTFSSTSLEGTTSWKSKGNHIIIQAGQGKDEGGYVVDIHVTVSGEVLKGSCSISKPEESLALLFPLEGDHASRAAYTHKAAGMSVDGRLEWGDREILFKKETSFATMDWTRSYAARETIWKWASFAGLAADQTGESVRVGLNLSAEVYDDKENAFWLDGKVYLVGPVTFTLPERKRLTSEKWIIQSPNKALKLEFTPFAAREENLHVGIIASAFSQVGGLFHGTIDVESLNKEGNQAVPTKPNLITISGLLGVVETHYALW